MSRRIGSVTPIWNQELWIKPHFEMLSKLDKNVVVLHERPLPNYFKEHGYSTKPDLSEKLIRELFPNVEIYKSEYPEGKEFGADIYNECLQYVQDCDIVFRLDPDMFFEDIVWEDLVNFVRESNYDCYRMNFARDSINYYMTGDFDHGLKDAQEMDPLAINPKYPLETPIITENGESTFYMFQYPHGNETVINFDDFMCHHARGWNKPKSTPNPEWKYSDYARMALQLHGDNGEWYHMPESIRNKIENWMIDLKEIKEQYAKRNI